MTTTPLLLYSTTPGGIGFGNWRHWGAGGLSSRKGPKGPKGPKGWFCRLRMILASDSSEAGLHPGEVKLHRAKRSKVSAFGRQWLRGLVAEWIPPRFAWCRGRFGPLPSRSGRNVCWSAACKCMLKESPAVELRVLLVALGYLKNGTQSPGRNRFTTECRGQSLPIDFPVCRVVLRGNPGRLVVRFCLLR